MYALQVIQLQKHHGRAAFVTFLVRHLGYNERVSYYYTCKTWLYAHLKYK